MDSQHANSPLEDANINKHAHINRDQNDVTDVNGQYDDVPNSNAN